MSEVILFFVILVCLIVSVWAMKRKNFCVVPGLPYVGCEADIGTEFKKQADAAVQA
jgi:hypothetical protein